MRELDIQAATTFPVSPFAPKAQLKNEIFLEGTSPSKFTEQNFEPSKMPGFGAAHAAFHIGAEAGHA